MPQIYPAQKIFHYVQYNKMEDVASKILQSPNPTNPSSDKLTARPCLCRTCFGKAISTQDNQQNDIIFNDSSNGFLLTDLHSL